PKRLVLGCTKETALQWADKAKTALAPLPGHALKDMLLDLADYVVERIN
ncbi:MAG: polyprenyl synthetase family protein, partial [Pseudomonadota bacterium]